MLDEFGIPFNSTGGIMSLTDMARVCALKKWGGWYLDTDVKIPVSYTHLDVYKRQMPICSGTVGFSGWTVADYA